MHLLIGLLERRAQMVEWTKEDAHAMGTSKGKSSRLHRMSPSFIPAHDLSRGVLQIVQSLLGFLFMLAVMSVEPFLFNLPYIC